jgi:non-specific serine/threonine protein kinase
VGPAAGRRLQACLAEAIAALAPTLDAEDCGSPPRRPTLERAVRRHRVMALRYLDGMPVAAVQQRLHISRAECFRAQQEGVQAVADLLRDRWRSAPAAHASSTHPPAGGRPTCPARLPVPLTSFVGRERQLAALRRLLLGEPACGRPRLVTLTGPPGAGKTRLALRLAADGDEAFRRTCFVPLAAVENAELVPAALGAALGVREDGGDALLEDVREALAGPRALLVLDNFEHLLAARMVVADLLAACPGLTVVVTSRVPLHLSAEQQFPVPPLTLPPSTVGAAAEFAAVADYDQVADYEAVALFVDRARAVLPDFAVTRGTAATVARICARLDGLPLAIELAAARVKLLSPSALLARLDRGPGVLAGSACDLPARQQTLRHAIAWSYNLLSPHEAVLLRRLCVFVGGWTFEAAAAVCGQEQDDGDGEGSDRMLDGLGSLLDKSLVDRQEVATGETRYAMLETIREYARERLAETAEHEAVRRRHARYYLAVAERAAPEMRGPGEGDWFALLEREHSNFRAALDWCLGRSDAEGAEWGLRLCASLHRFWWIRGHLTEGRSRLQAALDLARRALPHPSAAVTEARAMALYGAGLMAKYQGDYLAARAFHEEALALWRTVSDAEGVGHAVLTLGTTLYQLGDAAGARPLIEEGLATLRQTGDEAGAAWAVIHLGAALVALGRHAAARPVIERGLSRTRALGEQVATSWGLRYLAMVAYADGDNGTATALLEEGLSIGRQLGDRRQMAQQLELLGEVAAAEGRLVEAVRLAGTAAALRRAIGSPPAPIDKARLDRWLHPTKAALGGQAGVAWRDGEAAAHDWGRRPSAVT